MNFDFDVKEAIRDAYRIAACSNDPSTQNGALIVSPSGDELAWGFNCFTHGVKETEERMSDRTLKMQFIEHAERNALYQAAFRGISTHNKIMVCPWAPCTECARAIVQSGISDLIVHKQMCDKTPDDWKEDIDFAIDILRMGGVGYHKYDGPIGAASQRFRGEIWNP